MNRSMQCHDGALLAGEMAGDSVDVGVGIGDWVLHRCHRCWLLLFVDGAGVADDVVVCGSVNLRMDDGGMLYLGWNFVQQQLPVGGPEKGPGLVLCGWVARQGLLEGILQS